MLPHVMPCQTLPLVIDSFGFRDAPFDVNFGNEGHLGITGILHIALQYDVRVGLDRHILYFRFRTLIGQCQYLVFLTVCQDIEREYIAVGRNSSLQCFGVSASVACPVNWLSVIYVKTGIGGGYVDR